MKSVDFTIDPNTGDLEMHIQGVKGKKCDDIAKIVKELLGAPGDEHTTREYNEAEVPNQVVVGR